MLSYMRMTLCSSPVLKRLAHLHPLADVYSPLETQICCLLFCELFPITHRQICLLSASVTTLHLLIR